MKKIKKPAISYEKLLKQCQDVFEVQYHSLYYDLIKVLKAIYNLWPFVFNNEEQKRFYAMLFIFNKFCYCFNEENSEYSQEITKFLNFFYFWFFDYSYCIWSGFSLNITNKNEDLNLLWKCLNEINARLLIITQKNMPNLYKWTLQFKELGNSYYDVFCLTWRITNFNYVTFPYLVLDEFVLEDEDFIEYYFQQKARNSIALSKEQKDIYIDLYQRYASLNRNTKLDISKAENIKSILIKEMI